MKLKLKEMATIMEFEGLKFKRTDFRFSNRQEMDKFFNEALIESPLKFIRLNDQMYVEKIHISFSWMLLMRFMTWVAFVPAFVGIYYGAPQWFGFACVGISLFSFFRTKGLQRRLNSLVAGRNFFKEMAENDMSSLEEVREELINNK